MLLGAELPARRRRRLESALDGREAAAAHRRSSSTRRCSTGRCGRACAGVEAVAPGRRAGAARGAPAGRAAARRARARLRARPGAARRRRPGDRLLGGRDARSRAASCSRSGWRRSTCTGRRRPRGEQLELRGGDHARRASSSSSSDIDVLDAGGPLPDAPDGLGGQALRRARALRAAGAPGRARARSRRRGRGAAGALSAGLPRRCRPPGRRAPGRPPRCGSRCGPRRVLGRRERELFAALTLPERRQLEWLAARTAAKECVAELARRRARPRAAAGRNRDPARRARARRSSSSPALEGAGRSCRSSRSSHSHGEAAALAMLARAAARRASGSTSSCSSRAREGFAQARLHRGGAPAARGAARRRSARSGCCACGARARRRARRSGRASARARIAPRDGAIDRGARRGAWSRSDGATARRLDAPRAGPGRGQRPAPRPRSGRRSERRGAMTEIDPQVLQGILALLEEAQGDWEYDGRDRPGHALHRRPRARVAGDRGPLDDGPAAVRQAAVPAVLRGDRPAPRRGARPDRRGARARSCASTAKRSRWRCEMGPTLLIGLDGATFTVLDPYMEARRDAVPRRSCRPAGRARVLRSIMPPLTPPAWTSLVTGKHPGQHGIFDFFQKEEPGSVYFSFASSQEVAHRDDLDARQRTGPAGDLAELPADVPGAARRGRGRPGRDDALAPAAPRLPPAGPVRPAQGSSPASTRARCSTWSSRSRRSTAAPRTSTPSSSSCTSAASGAGRRSCAT